MSTNLLLIAAFIASMILMSMNYAKRRKKVLFFGDSITEEGVSRNGYINRLKEFMRYDGEDEKYELVGAGVAGDKLQDLLERMEKDVLAKFPDIVVVFAGINDVWQKLSSGSTTNHEKVQEYYSNIIERLMAANLKVVLCTPAVIGEKPDGSNELDKELDSFNIIVKNLAHTYHLHCIDLRRAFTNYNHSNNPENKSLGILTNDGVHLNDKGNIVVAEEIWKVLKEVR